MDDNDFFCEKIILAPMVRMNTLPFRLLALDQGADIVFSEEIIDYKLLRSDRQYNDVLKTVDYIDKTDGSLIFRTCSQERNKIVFQIGTSCPERAARVASFIEQDVAGIDINMGCPKHFSLSGGMGAALLSNHSNAPKIIERIKQSVSIPVTCKIRVKENVEETISFCKLMQKSGVSAISVHGRTPLERPQHSNRSSVIKRISEELSIPVIANGGSNEIENYADVLLFKQKTACTSVMIARAAQYNCSIFNKNEKLPLDEIIKRYLKYAIDYDNCFPNTKYCVQSILRDLQDTPRGKIFLETQNLEQICEIWGLENYCRKKSEEFRSQGFLVQYGILLENQRKRFKLDLSDTLVLCSAFIRSYFLRDADLPKSVLLRYAQKQRYQPPRYNTKNLEKLFQSIVTFNDKKYASSHWEKNKKSAEQGAAIVCLCYLKIYDENELRIKGIIK